MAEEEVRASLPAGNGERMELRVGTKSLGFTTKDLASVLIIVVLAGLGYFMAHNVTENQRQGFAGLAQILEKMSTFQTQSLEKMSANQQTLLELVHTNRAQMMEELSRQNLLVHQQTTALQEAVNEQTESLRRMLITLNYNLSHEPQERIPLEFLPSEMPHPEKKRER